MNAQQFKVGDRVRVVRKFVSRANGWTAVWNSAMDPTVGCEGVIRGLYDRVGYTVCGDGWDWTYHPESLELVPTAESLLLALGTASRELEEAITAERDAHAVVEAAATRRARASEAHAEALKAVREAAMARAAA